MEAAGHLFLSLSSRVRSGGTRWGGRATRLLLDIYLARLLAGDYTECRHGTTTPNTRTTRLAVYRWDGVFTVYISQILKIFFVQINVFWNIISKPLLDIKHIMSTLWRMTLKRLTRVILYCKLWSCGETSRVIKCKQYLVQPDMSQGKWCSVMSAGESGQV